MRIAALTPRVIDQARRQGGVITREDILRLGASTGQVTSLVRAGVLIRIHPGVFVLGGAVIDHPLRLRAAVTAVGPEAVASHESAAWLQGLIDRPPALVHLTAGTGHRHLEGVVVHRSRLAPPKGPRFRGIECTPPARTLLDLAAALSQPALADAVDRALANGVTRTNDLVALTKAARGNRPGVAAMRRCLDDRGITNVPKPSVLESKMARLLLRYGLPPAPPEYVAGSAGEYRIDYAYPDRRVAVELYGYSNHRSPERLRADQARQRKLTIEGWTMIIFTWRDVVDTPSAVAKDIRRALLNSSNSLGRAGIRNP